MLPSSWPRLCVRQSFWLEQDCHPAALREAGPHPAFKVLTSWSGGGFATLKRQKGRGEWDLWHPVELQVIKPLVPSLPRVKTSMVVPTTVSASLEVCCVSLLALFFWWFTDGFHQFLAQFTAAVWEQLVLLHQLHCGVRSDLSKWPCKTRNTNREPAFGFRDFGSGTESCQNGSYCSGTKILRKAIVGVNWYWCS